MRTAKAQDGVTLVGLMVGLVISMIVTVALMSVFRNVVQVTVQAKDSSTDDDQLTSALLRTGMSLADAGYGITAPAFGTHLIMIRNATMTGTALAGTAVPAGTAANAVVWAMQTGTAIQCAGLYAPATTGLISLDPVNCADASGWSSTTWPSSTIAGQSNGPIVFTASQASCKPFGIPGTSGAYAVTLSATNGAGLSVNSMTCLMNFH